METNKVSQKTILAIMFIILMSIIMSVSSLAWDGYPDTPNSDEYDNSYIYQVIIKNKHLTEGTKTWLYVSQTPFYRKDETALRSSSTLHMLEINNKGNWRYWGTTQTIPYIEILQSTHDIYTDSSLTDVFFSATRRTPMQETLNQFPPLSLMSPLIRGITPYLIGLLIALVGFWKGLQFLFKTLHKA